MKKKLLFFWTVILSFLVVALGLYTLSLGFREGYMFGKGSYAYYVLLPKDMRQVPTAGDVKQDPIYQYSVGDGQPPNQYSISYKTDLAPEAVRDFYRQYFSKQGLATMNSKELYSEDHLGFSTKNGYYEIAASPESSGNSTVVVSFNELH